MTRHYCVRSSMARSGGAALLIIVLILGTAFTVLFVSALSKRYIDARKEQITNDSLARAREALLAYALAQNPSGSIFPGQFPCPDRHDPNDAVNGGIQGDNTLSNCRTNARRLGRLPWRTLGIPPLRDGAGELLWYMVVEPFDEDSGSAVALNSDAPGQLQVYQQGGSVSLTTAGNQAAVIVFAPGAPLAGQNRTTSAELIAPANYLDSVGIPNATGTFNNAETAPATLRLNGPLLNVAGTDTVLNDRLAIITQMDLMSKLEQRVAREYKELLQNYTRYSSAPGKYPFPANPADSSCLGTSGATNRTNCAMNASYCRGRVPNSGWLFDQLNKPVASSVSEWDGLRGSYNWLYQNRWEQVIYYAAGTNMLATAPANCSPSITVNGAAANAVLITSGPQRGGQSRATLASRSVLANYLDDALNQTGWTGTAPAADQYITPTETSNDRLDVLP